MLGVVKARKSIQLGVGTWCKEYSICIMLDFGFPDFASSPVEFGLGSPPSPGTEKIFTAPADPDLSNVEIQFNSPEGATEVVTETTPSRGPRIKHVCRKAAVALGTPATFPPLPRELRLSALPVVEKEKILKLDEMERPGMLERLVYWFCKS